MTKTIAVLRFELGYQLGRASTRFYFALFVVFAALLAYVLLDDARRDGYFFNAPLVTTLVTIIASMMSLLITAGVAGDAATRDRETRLDSLIYTSPLRKTAYLGGRFLGAFAVTALLLLGVPAGLLLTTFAGVEPAVLGPFRVEAYLTSYFVFALVNTFTATALLFSLAAVTRRAIAAYAGAASLFFAAVISEGFVASHLGHWTLAKMLDPLAFTSILAMWRESNPLQRNTLLVSPDGLLLSNRLFWLGFAVAVLMLALARFRFAYDAGSGGSQRSDAINEAIAPRWAHRTMPSAVRAFGRATRWRQILAIAGRSFRELLAGRAWWIVPVVALLFVVTAPELLEVELGTPGAATAARVADLYAVPELGLLIALLIALSAGELVWRERNARIAAITDVAPVPSWVSFTAKFLALALMLVAAHVVFLVAGILVQITQGGSVEGLDLHLQILFGAQLVPWLLIAALAMFVHVLANQKYVGHVLVLLAFVGTDIARELGVRHNLLLYASAPEWSYSEMSGWGPEVRAWGWFMLYWGGWAVLLAIASHLFWIRGEESGMRARLARVGARLTRPTLAVAAIALLIIAGAGGFTYWNTNVLNHHSTEEEIEARRAAYERLYGRYATLAQPQHVATSLNVEFYPDRREATVRGRYRLENAGGTPILSIHIVTNTGVETSDVVFSRASRATLVDDDLGYRIHELAIPLRPGESIEMSFRVAFASRGFTNEGGDPGVTGNGSWFEHRGQQTQSARQWLPVVGYERGRELSSADSRARFGLPPRQAIASLDDRAAARVRKGREQIAFEAVIGTDGDQIGVAPGALQRVWKKNGRTYTHYVTGAPISNMYAVLSGRYAIHRAKWRDVAIEIFHHPEHTANLESMVHAAQASLEYHAQHFSPYPYRQLRMVQYPTPAQGLRLTAFPGLIRYSEGFALVRAKEDSRGIDFPFAVLSHEMAHQWWGHQLVPAEVEGAGLLSESLAWYSAMLVVEETFGHDHLKRILDVMRREYMAPHATRDVPLVRMSDRLDAYRTGPFAMYALRQSVGTDRVNAALRSLLAQFEPGSGPLPTSRDLLRELRAATPAPDHPLLQDLFEEITFWKLEANTASAERTGPDTWRITLQIEAEKLKADALGKEKPVAMNDTIDVNVRGAEGTTLYRHPHRIRSGAQTITVAVRSAQPPARAGIDPDHVLLDRAPEDNEIAVAIRGTSR